MAIPSSVVAGTFVDEFGVPVSGITVLFTLETFAQRSLQGPFYIQGVGILGNYQAVATTDASGQFSVTIFGNDIIQVGSGSYFQVMATKGGQTHFRGRFQFLQGGSYDLLTATPLVPFPAQSPIGPPPGSAEANQIFAGPVSGTSQLPVFRDLVTDDLPTNGTWPFAGALTGAFTASSIDAILAVDGVKYTTVQAAIAALPANGGIVFVPTGTLVSGVIDMASNVHLIFGAGVFVNQNSSGGNNFIQFGSGVTGASVSGQGVGVTILQNNTTASQFGTVITDQGTENTVSDLTIDGNNNTTCTGIWRQTTRSACRNVKALSALPIGITSIVGNGTVATVTCVANILPPNGVKPGQVLTIAGNTESAFNTEVTVLTGGTTTFTFASTINATGTGGFLAVTFINNAIDVEGGTDHEFTNITTIGGPDDGFALTTDDLGSQWGSLVGGRYTNIFCAFSPNNGFSINALGANGANVTVTNVVINNLRCFNNGFVGTPSSGGTDDMAGLEVVCNLTTGDETSISDCSFSNINCNGNGGPGVRVKGTVTRCSFHGTAANNGLRQLTTFNPTDAIVTAVGADGANHAPFYNLVTMSGDAGNGTYFVNEVSASFGNLYLASSPDAVNLGGNSGYITSAAATFNEGFPNPTTDLATFYNQNGVGPTISGPEFQVRTGSTPTTALTIDGNQIATFANGASAGPFTSVSSIQTVGGIVTALSGSSDERLKDSTPYSDGLSAILAIHPVKYTMNARGQKQTGLPSDLMQIGFLAQDIQRVIPEAITSAEICKTDHSTRYLCLDTKGILAAAVNAIRELNTKIETLEAKLRAI